MRDLVADEVCAVGHAIYGPADIQIGRDGIHRCAKCVTDMAGERPRYVGAEMERMARGGDRRTGEGRRHALARALRGRG